MRMPTTHDLLRASIMVAKLNEAEGSAPMANDRQETNKVLKELVVATNQTREAYKELLARIRGINRTSIDRDTLTIVTLPEAITDIEIHSLNETVKDANLPGHYLFLRNSLNKLDSYTVDEIDELMCLLRKVRRHKSGDTEVSGINIMEWY